MLSLDGSMLHAAWGQLFEEGGQYRITFQDDLLRISEGQSVVAFFRAPHVISTIECAGERIGVGSKNGDVLHLRADWFKSGLTLIG